MPVVFGGATTTVAKVTSLPRTPDAFTWMLWHYPTTITDGRRFCGRSGVGFDMEISWDFGVSGRIYFQADRTGGIPFIQATGNKVYTTNKWWFIAATVTVGSNPRLYWGDDTSPPVEDTYATQDPGSSGSLVDDSASTWAIGNLDDGTGGLAYQGRIARFMRFDAELTLEQITNLWRPSRIPPYEISTALRLHAPLRDISNIRDEGPNSYTLTTVGTLTNADGPGADPSNYAFDQRRQGVAALPGQWKIINRRRIPFQPQGVIDTTVVIPRPEILALQGVNRSNTF